MHATNLKSGQANPFSFPSLPAVKMLNETDPDRRSLRRSKPSHKIDASTCNDQLRPPTQLRTNTLSLQKNTLNSAQTLAIDRSPIDLIDPDRLQTIGHQNQSTSDRFLKFSLFFVPPWLCVRFDPNPSNPIDHPSKSLETNATNSQTFEILKES
jgi:hypothetical protein